MDGVAGIVLAGGRSSRMGTPKASLEWHGSTLLRRAVGIVARVTGGPVVVVRAAGQDLPGLPAWVDVVEDAREGRGPLQGIASGMAALAGRAERVYVSATDAPLLHPAFVRRVVTALDDGHDVAIPCAHGFRHPLSAAYHTALLPIVQELVATDRLRPAELLARCRARLLTEAALLADPLVAAFDPVLDSLLSLNEPGHYDEARASPPPEVTVRRLGALATDHGREPVTVRAATLGAAAAAAGIALDEHVVAALDGARTTGDPEEPLAAGDAVVFRPADR